MASTLNYSIHSRLEQSADPSAMAELRSRPLERERSWKLSMSFGQVLLMCGIAAIAIFIAGVFGFYAGREQGVQIALASEGSQSIRIPIVNSGRAGPGLPVMERTSGSEELNAAQPERAPADSEGTFDFSSNHREVITHSRSASAATFDLGRLEQEDGTSFATHTDREKPGLELFKNEAEGAGAITARSVARSAARGMLEPGATASLRQKPAAPEPAAATGIDTATTPKSGDSGQESIAGQITAGWYVQLIAAKSKGEAETVTKKLKRSRMKSALEIANIRERTF